MKIKFLYIFLVLSVFSYSQSVVISQYIETNSGTTPKGIEIFNVTASDIVFSAGNNLQVFQGTNGAACTTVLANITSGTLEAGKVWVIGTSDLITYTTANGTNFSGTTTVAFNFNGDDALRVDLAGVTQDMFGLCGNDPGTAWSGSGVTTANNNLQIIDGFCTGDTDGWTDPSTRFTSIAIGTVMTGFGDSPASCTTPCSTPSSQSSSILSSNITASGFDLSWTAGATASGSIVVIRPAATLITNPTDGVNYTPNVNWATAAQIDVNNRVIYRSNGTSVSGITGLLPETLYTITVYAYNGSGTNICYNNASPESITIRTLAAEATAHAASFTCSTVSVTQINLTFSAANTIGGDGYVVLYRIGAAPTGVPTDGTFYTAGTIIGDATVHGYTSNSGTTTTYNATGLNAGSTYYFSLIPYSSYLSDPTTINYRTVATIPVTNCSTSIGPEINVRGIVGANPSISDGDTTPQGTDNTLFATVVVGNNQAKNFRIENNGNANLTVSSITMVGGNTADFVVSGISLPATIIAGSFLDFTVTFSPLASGTRNTTLTIANNDSDENPYNFLIQGNGTVVSAVEINVTGNGQSIPDNSIYPVGTNHTAFGLAIVSSTTVIRTFTIENLGSTALTLTGTPHVTITGPHAAMFSVTAQPSSNTIAGSSSLTFDVTFNPTSPGAKNATIVINNSDTDENPYNFNISGTAKGTNNIYVYGAGNDIIKGSTTTATTNLTNYGSVAVTTGVKQNTFVISNLSGATTYYSNVTISGTDAAMFSIISQPTNNALASGNSTSFTINFTPTSTGIKNATVSFNVYTNSARTTPEPVDPVFTFAISGNGIVYTTCTLNPVETILYQDFEDVPATPTWNYTYTTDGTVNIAGGTYNNGSTARNAFIGAKSFQFTGVGTSSTRTTVINLNPVDLSNYSNTNLSFKVGAFRTGTTQGLDINELIQVETSIDGGVNWSTESVLRAYSNSRWDFNATGVFNAYYTGTNTGATIDTRNGGAELADGIATYYVNNLPSLSNFLIRITLQIDRNDEIWAIDELKLEGRIPVTTTWNGSTWSAGYPNTSTKTVFNGNYNTSSNLPGNIETCECQILTNRIVTVTSGNYLEVQSDLYNNGTLNVNDNGSLVQINDDATNTGTINYERVATMFRSDYVYWSSPVDGFNVNNISPLSPSNFIWKWDADLANVNGGLGYWINAAGSTMTAGEGYIVRGPNSFDDITAQDLTATFTGRQNNGFVTVPIKRGAMTAATLGTYTSANGIAFTVNDDNWNLIGNPFPSAIRVLDFLSLNTNIEGAVRIWTHGNLPAAITNPFYGSYLYNYTPNDYITHNGTGTLSGPSGFNGYIAGGQGFFVLMDEGAADTSQTVTFNNSLRNKSYNNAQFYRTGQNVSSFSNEKHRIWLDLVSSSNQSVRTLVGYVDGATSLKDRLFDAYTGNNLFNLYSLVNDEMLCIQAKGLPFDENDSIELGISIPSNGNYSFAIAAVDGLFEGNQTIYLEDKLLNIVHDIKSSPYNFYSNSGNFTDRFVLRYTNTLLSNEQFVAKVNDVIVFTNNNQISVKSYSVDIKKVEVYDILGRQLTTLEDVNSNETSFTLIAKNQTLLVKTILQDNSIVIKKVMN